MIEILDKINNTFIEVESLKFAIHPLNGEITDLKTIDEYLEEGLKISGVIFKEDGSTLVLYKRVDK